MKCHVLVIEQTCRDLAVRFDRHVAGQATIFVWHLLITHVHGIITHNNHTLVVQRSVSVLDEPLCTCQSGKVKVWLIIFSFAVSASDCKVSSSWSSS